MNILYIEPYFSGSHKQWALSLKNHTKHNIDIISLPGRKWKWRMHGGAVTLAEKFLKNNKSYDLILASDILNLPVFKSICCDSIKNTKIVIYFHENQITYPWSPEDDDPKMRRDLHYAFINYSSSLVSSWNFFNSDYHLNSYINGLKIYLNKMPDFNNVETIQNIRDKSSVLHLGCDLLKMKTLNKSINDTPIILWNHRWEYDKNPIDFFEALYRIKKEGAVFKLVILGEKYSKYPSVFDEAKLKLNDEIIHFGYCKSYEEYVSWLNKTDIIPVTSNQDFFGVSIVEAIYMNNYPILPKRLSYTELINIDNHPEIFYNTNEELYRILLNCIINYKDLRKSTIKYRELINRFDWSIIIREYDEKFEFIYNS